MWEDFKEFISRGNVIDLAVGVIIGASFTAIVTSLVDDIFMPVVGAVSGGTNIEGMVFVVGDATIGYGNFMVSVIDFLLVAFLLFLFVRFVARVNRLRKAEEAKAAAEAAPPEPTGEEKILAEIRDMLEKNLVNS